MRYVLTLLVAISVAVTLLTVEIVLRMPNEEEVALFGPKRAHADLAQMRMARLILAVDPRHGSRALAALTGADPELVEANLREMARLDVPPPAAAPPDAAQTAASGAPTVEEPHPQTVMDIPEEDARPRVREMRNGGARFVRVN